MNSIAAKPSASPALPSATTKPGVSPTISAFKPTPPPVPSSGPSSILDKMDAVGWSNWITLAGLLVLMVPFMLISAHKKRRKLAAARQGQPAPPFAAQSGPFPSAVQTREPMVKSGRFCGNCGTPATGEDSYCTKCGSALPEMSRPPHAPTPPVTPSTVYCSGCGTQNTGDSLFCKKCSKKLLF